MGRLDIFNRTTVIAELTAALLLYAATAQAEDKEKESSAEIAIGAAGEWAMPSEASSFGPSAAIEFTPIKERLEIELGVSPMFSRGQTQYDTELVFKTPLRLGLPDNVEVMFGGGPAWLHTVGGGKLPTPLALRCSWIFRSGNCRRESSAGAELRLLSRERT